MSSTRRKTAYRKEALSALAGYVLLSVAFVACMELRHPQWTDREYAARRHFAQQRSIEHPDRPVFAVLGSSRVGAGFVPEELAPIVDGDGRQVSVINFSHRGAGPRLNRVQLQRLLDDGIRPRWLLLEITTPYLHQERMIFAELAFRDVDTLLPYADENRYVRQPVIYRLEAANRYRHGPLEELAPSFATGHPVKLRAYGGDDGWERPQGMDEQKLAELQNVIRGQYAATMAAWQVNSGQDLVLRDTITYCRAEGIEPVLIWFPESTRFRGWYGPGAEDRLQAYVKELRASLRVLVYDTRAWMSDDQFIDPHHLTEDGSVRYTKRLEAEVLRPIVAEPTRLAGKAP